MTATIRPATPADIPLILALIRELAAYERQPDAVVEVLFVALASSSSCAAT